MLTRLMDTLALLLPDFTLILVGYLLCRHTPLNRTVWEQVEAVVYFLLFPVLLFYSIVRNPIDVRAASSFAASGWITGLSAIALSYALPWVFGKHIDRQEHAAAAQVGFRFNSFIGLALVLRLAGAPGMATFAILIGVCVPLFNVAAVWPMARHSQQGVWRAMARNPLIWATGSGLLLNLLGFRMPDWLVPSVERVGQSSIALGLLTAGASMRLERLAHDKLLGVSVLVIRHLCTPLVAWATARALGLDPTQTLVLLVFAAVPTASSCHVLASRMGYDGSYVAGLVTLSTLLGLVSLPWAINVLAR